MTKFYLGIYETVADIHCGVVVGLVSMYAVNPRVRDLFPTNPIPEKLLTGRLKFFYSNWAKLTQGPNILNIVQGFLIPFFKNPVQGKSANPPVLNQEQSKLVKMELMKMLLKAAIQYSCYHQAKISTLGISFLYQRGLQFHPIPAC